MILGVGVDTVDIPRFEDVLKRSPAVVRKILRDSERILADGQQMSSESLAARFAAKEAATKALGCPGGTDFFDIEVVVGDKGKPLLRLHGKTAKVAESLGVSRWHLSLSHDGDKAVAFVIAEKDG